MPLLKKRPIQPHPTPHPYTLDDLNVEVFQIRFTGEIFLDYEEYIHRLFLYRQKIWSCEATTRTGLTFEEALESEREHRRKTDEKFPQPWRRPCLETIHFSSFPQVELVDFFADYFKDHVCIGEVVAVPVPGISQPEYAEILSATRIKPASNPNTAAPDSSATTETTSISSANAQSTTTAPPLPPIVTATSTGNPTSSAQVSPSKKSSSSSAHAMLVTKPLTNSFRISEHEIHVVMLNPGGFDALDRRFDAESGNMVVRTLLPGDYKKSKMYSPTKLIFKQFLKDCAYKDSWNGAPWIVKPHLVAAYSLVETAPPELQLLIDAKSRFSGGGGGHANGSGFGGGSTSPGKQGGFLQIDKMTMSKKPISEAKRVIKFPMDDIELLQVAPRDGTLEDGSPIPDYPALSTEFFGLASNRIGTLLSVWEFLMVMSEPLRLTPFTLDDFNKALLHTIVTPQCALIVESVGSLVSLCCSHWAQNNIQNLSSSVSSLSTAITAAAAAAAVGSGGASSLSAAGAIDNTDAMDTSADDVDPNTNGHIAATTNTGEQESSQPPQPPPPVDPLAQETAAILADTRLTLNQREAKARFYQAFFALSTMEQVSINQWFKWYPGRWASGYEKRRGKGIRQTGIPNADRMKAMEIAIVGFLRDGVTEEGVPEKWDILDKLLHKYERPSSEKDQDSDAASVNGGEEQEDEEAGDEDTVADHASSVNVNLNNYKSTTASSSVNGDNSNNKWDGVEGGEESELSDVGEYEENDGEVDDDDDDDDNHGGASKRKRKSKVQQQPRKTYKRKVHVKSRASRRIQVLDEKKEEDHDELEDDDDDDNYHQQTRTSSRRGATKSSNSKSTRRSSTRRESASSSLPSSPGALAAIQMVEQEISKKPRGDLSGGDAVMTTERNARREQREESAKVNANASSENIDDLCRVVEHNFMSLLSPEEKLIIMSRLIEDYAVDSEDIKTYIDECSRKSWEIKMELKEVVRDRKAVELAKAEFEKRDNFEQNMTEAELEAIKKEIQDDASQDGGGDDDDESLMSASKSYSSRVIKIKEEKRRKEEQERKAKLQELQSKKKIPKKEADERRHILDQCKKLARKEHELQLKYHYLSGACRIKALGYDRNHVQYIYLDAFVGAVDELGGYEDYISTQKYREKCVSGLNWGAGRLFVGTPSPSGDGGRNWGYLCEPEQIDQLLNWLDTRGIRENALSKNIEKYVDPIALGMAARREFLNSAAYTDPKKRSKRGGRVFPNSDDFVLWETFLDYRNRRAKAIK